MAKVDSDRRFKTRLMEGHVLEVWDGEFDHPESDLILKIDVSLVPRLIATLKGWVKR